MKKSLLLIAALSVAVLAGCEEQTYIYEKEQMKETYLEEKIADQLEVENPELDIEVDVYQESDD